MDDNDKLFEWQNLISFVRGVIEPHVQSIRHRLDAYIVFNDDRHAKFKAWTESQVRRLDKKIDDLREWTEGEVDRLDTKIDDLRAWTQKELNSLRSWTQQQINSLNSRIDSLSSELGDFKSETTVNFDRTNNYIDSVDTTTNNNLIPIGMIVAWPSKSTIPNSSCYLECNGQSVPSSCSTLRSLIGSKTPNLNGYFLRGTSTSSKVLSVSQDTIRGHTHKYCDARIAIGQYPGPGVYGDAEGKQHIINMYGELSKVLMVVAAQTAAQADLSLGGLPWGSVAFDVNGFDNVYEQQDKGEETAPMHVYVRYYIRSK